MNLTIEGKVYSRPLLVFAMQAEAGNEFDNYDKLFTGIGKVNAAYHLTRYLAQNPEHDIVINLGTAGSSVFNRGEIVLSTRFVQRDMDVTGLGLPKYKTPFIEEEPEMAYGLNPSGFVHGVCGSGDNFETAQTSSDFSLIDMEAYVYAFISKRENFPFLCLKFISDGADDSAAEDWSSQLKQAAKALRKALSTLEV